MTIYISPRIRSFHGGSQIEYCIDKNWYKFLENVAPGILIKTLISQDGIKDFDRKDLLIISGGNNISKISDQIEDNIRNKITIKQFEMAIEKKLKIIGICYGAQFIADYYQSSTINVKNHIGNHDISMNENSKIFNHEIRGSYNTNSFHDYAIENLGVDLSEVFVTEDKSIEMFKHKNIDVYGIMWHPERYPEPQELDIKIFNHILNDK